MAGRLCAPCCGLWWGAPTVCSWRAFLGFVGVAGFDRVRCYCCISRRTTDRRSGSASWPRSFFSIAVGACATRSRSSGPPGCRAAPGYACPDCQAAPPFGRLLALRRMSTAVRCVRLAGGLPALRRPLREGGMSRLRQPAIRSASGPRLRPFDRMPERAGGSVRGAATKPASDFTGGNGGHRGT